MGLCVDETVTFTAGHARGFVGHDQSSGRNDFRGERGLFATPKGIKGTVGVACCGDGATSTGSFHEALNQAAVEKLPLVMVVADNQFAYSTPTSKQFACDSLLERAAGYGVPGQQVDGTNLAACLEVVGAAVGRARADQGPQLVVARLLRLCGHGEHDDSSYIDATLRNSPIGRDCLKLAEQCLLDRGWADAPTVANWRSEVVEKVEAAVLTVTPNYADQYSEKWSALSNEQLQEGE
jgi:pyruvate dehydrogenase E1 component alpha subunit/2-oxoisovalerate dehydrogenase E1 component alpha subunit